MRLSKKVFTDLAIWMIGFGVLIGVIFPFFTMLLGVPVSTALSAGFFISCIIAGILVGLVNILLSRLTVGKRLRLLTEKMNYVKKSVIKISDSGDIGDCTPEKCNITIDSTDEFGQSAQAFNELIVSFFNSLQTLDEIKKYTSNFSSQLDLQALAGSALDLIMKASSANAGSVLIEKEGDISLLSSFGIKDAQLLCNKQIVLDAFSKGSQYRVTYPDDIVVESILTDFHPKEVLIEPVKFKGFPIAVIILASSEEFKPDLDKQLLIFSLSLAISLHNALEHEQLQKLAALDSLTGILNRRFGMVRFHEEYMRSVRKELPLGVLMFDIDHFKQVNDTYGHIAGDRVLKNITQQIRQAMREGDILMRYGGEEFLLVLPGASKDDAFQIAERVRHIVKDSKIDYGSNSISVTVSIGCDSSPETSAATEQDLILNADEALYRAKSSGRDKSVIH